MRTKSNVYLIVMLPILSSGRRNDDLRRRGFMLAVKQATDAIVTLADGSGGICFIVVLPCLICDEPAPTLIEFLFVNNHILIASSPPLLLDAELAD